MADLTERLLGRLWAAFGDPASPSEWDGAHGHGGRLSQRFWEYHWTIRQARLDGQSVVLDVGAGPTVFLPRLLAPEVREVVACDPDLPHPLPSGVRGIRAQLDASVVRSANFTHVLCVSVLEHLGPRELPGFLESLALLAVPIVMTLELGEHAHGSNLTMPDLYRVARGFRRHYCATIEACPVWADNAFPPRPAPGGHNLHALWRPLGIVLRPLGEAT